MLDQVHEQIARLPESVVGEVLEFVESLSKKHNKSAESIPPYDSLSDLIQTFPLKRRSKSEIDESLHRLRDEWD